MAVLRAPRAAVLSLVPFALLVVAGLSCGSPARPVAVAGRGGAPAARSAAAPPAAPAVAPVAPPVPESCARRGSAAIARAVGDVDASSAVALVAIGASRFAYIADEADKALRVVDLAAGTEVGATSLPGAPSEALVLPDGRVAVSLADAGAVVVLEPDVDPAKPFELRCRVRVAAEPAGLALSPDRGTLFVASRWGHALTALDAVTLGKLFAVDLPRDPRAVVVSADGATAFVSHVTGGRISAVSLAAADHAVRDVPVGDVALLPEVFVGMPMAPPPRPMLETSDAGLKVTPPPRRVIRHVRFGGQGYALARAADGAILAAHTLVEPESAGASGGYGGGGDERPPIVADIGVIGTDGELAPASFGPLTVSDCLLPRAIAVDAPRGRVLVACRGLDRVIAYDARAKHPHLRELGRTAVGAGPAGMAIDPETARAWVWSTFDRTLAAVRTEGDGKRLEAERRIAIARRSAAPSEDVLRGQALFHAASARRLAADGRACASCHPDGRDDGLTWATPEGPRQTPMLCGRLDDTAPYGWDGARTTLLTHLDRTLERLHGTGIDKAERASLFAYIGAMKMPEVADAATDASRRGQAIFESDEAGCAGCHAGPASTDGLGHDVGSVAKLDRHTGFDTPSLRFIGRTAPFFHDGRYATLRALLRDPKSRMGKTSHLAEADLAALEAYLETL